MEIEVTGSIKKVNQKILSVSEDLEIEASYDLVLAVQLDQNNYLSLKRMELLEETICIHLKAAQLELPEEPYEPPAKLSIFAPTTQKDNQDAEARGSGVGALSEAERVA